MPNYAFYLSEYMGDVVDEESFPRLAARADEQLCRYERIYTVTEPEEGARDMAICNRNNAVRRRHRGFLCQYWECVCELWIAYGSWR